MSLGDEFLVFRLIYQKVKQIITKEVVKLVVELNSKEDLLSEPIRIWGIYFWVIQQSNFDKERIS